MNRHDDDVWLALHVAAEEGLAARADIRCIEQYRSSDSVAEEEIASAYQHARRAARAARIVTGEGLFRVWCLECRATVPATLRDRAGRWLGLVEWLYIEHVHRAPSVERGQEKE